MTELLYGLVMCCFRYVFLLGRSFVSVRTRLGPFKKAVTAMCHSAASRRSEFCRPGLHVRA